jgi:hypothetical protein
VIINDNSNNKKQHHQQATATATATTNSNSICSDNLTMHPTAVAAKLVTTQAGMRCILKKLPPVNKYMRLAVDAGIYRDRDDDGGADFLDVREGPDARYVEDYPIEYQIMMLHPPHPYHPPLPRYLQRRMEHARKPHETQTLMRSDSRR